MRISDWSSDVCSSDLREGPLRLGLHLQPAPPDQADDPPRRRAQALGRPGRFYASLDALTRGALGGGAGEGCRRPQQGDRKSAVQGKSVSVRVDLVGSGLMKKKTTIQSMKR